MFKNLFKKKVQSPINIKEVIVPCACDGNNEHCDLVLKLRECQELKKKIEREIETLKKDSRELLSNFFDFLKKLELGNFRMNSYSNWTENERNMHILEYTISDLCSSGDIFRMTEGLIIYKNCTNSIYEKERALKAVKDDIENIKTKLGIE